MAEWVVGAILDSCKGLTDRRVYELVGDQIRRHFGGRPLLNVVLSG